MNDFLYNPHHFIHLEKDPKWVRDLPMVVIGRVVIPGHVLLIPAVALLFFSVLIGIPVLVYGGPVWIAVLSIIIYILVGLVALIALLAYLASTIEVRGPDHG